MTALAPALILAAFAILNRMRGGGLGADRLPGHPRFYVAPVIFGLALWWMGDFRAALWFATAWLAWSLQPWGDLYMMGRGALSRSDCWIGLVGVGGWAGVLLAPLTVWGPALCLAVPLAYEIGWSAYDRWPGYLKAQTPVAEPLIGMAWGAVLLTI